MNEFIIIAVATEDSAELKRFKMSCELSNVPYKILGMNTTWNGGDMANGTGGGQKVNLLRNELKTWTTRKLRSTLILVSDSYDVIVLASVPEIIEKYNMTECKILFSTEKFCWPDSNLKQYYSNSRYLNSGGFMGNASNIYNMIHIPINDRDDDQLYYTKLFLFNNNNTIQLDYNCEIFQTLNGENITIEKTRVKNKEHNTRPCIIHGNGPPNIKADLTQICKHIFRLRM